MTTPIDLAELRTHLDCWQKAYQRLRETLTRYTQERK